MSKTWGSIFLHGMPRRTKASQEGYHGGVTCIYRAYFRQVWRYNDQYSRSISTRDKLSMENCPDTEQEKSCTVPGGNWGVDTGTHKDEARHSKQTPSATSLNVAKTLEERTGRLWLRSSNICWDQWIAASHTAYNTTPRT